MEFLQIWSVQICKYSKTKKEKKKTETNAFRGVLANLVCKTLSCSLLQRLSKFSRTQRKRKKKKTETNPFSGVLANLVCKTLNCSLLQRLFKSASTQRQRKKRKRQRQTPSGEFFFFFFFFSGEFLQIWSVRPFEVYYKGCPNLQGLKDKERKEKDRRLQGSSCKFGL